jgi:RNA 2',3'-cyclic 3'-phosphodiesterase
MRLFVAVGLEKEVRDAAAQLIEQLDRALHGHRSSGRKGLVKWVEPDNLHLTLRFIGEVDEATSDVVRETLKKPLSEPPFTSSFEGLGVFPPNGPPRVIWVAATEGADALGRMHREVEERLTALGLAREDRPFRAHLTLGRFREPAGAETRRLLQGHEAVLGRCRVVEATLYSSRLSPAGPSYTPIVALPLGSE